VNILPAFWDERDYWRASAHIDEDWSQSYGSERSGLDCAFPLSVVHAGAPDFLAAHDSETLATLRAYLGSFDGMYSINKRTSNLGKGQSRPWRDGWAVGRYSEDIYNGIGVSRGNPW
jgi:glucoamylase